METGTGVSESLLTSAESSEVGGGLGDNVVEELEGDLAGGGTVDGDIEKDLAVYTKSKELLISRGPRRKEGFRERSAADGSETYDMLDLAETAKFRMVVGNMTDETRREKLYVSKGSPSE